MSNQLSKKAKDILLDVIKEHQTDYPEKSQQPFIQGMYYALEVLENSINNGFEDGRFYHFFGYTDIEHHPLFESIYKSFTPVEVLLFETAYSTMAIHINSLVDSIKEELFVNLEDGFLRIFEDRYDD